MPPSALHNVGAMIRAIAHRRTSARNEKTGSLSRLRSIRSVMSDLRRLDRLDPHAERAGRRFYFYFFAAAVAVDSLAYW